MEKRQSGSRKQSMSIFDKSYFLKYYRSSEDKSSPRKLSMYLSIVKQFVAHQTKKRWLLDIGCGYGKFLEIASRDFHVAGIDPSAYAIKEVRRLVPVAALSVLSLESFHPKKRFDVVTAFDVLEHLENPRQAIEKIHQLLFKEGVFVCVVPVYDGPFGMIGGWLDRDPTHLHKWNRWTWLRLFEKCFHVLLKVGIIRYTLPMTDRYIHVASPWFWQWGQALMVVMKK